MKTHLQNLVFEEIIKVLTGSKPVTNNEMKDWNDDAKKAYRKFSSLSRQQAIEWINENVDLDKSIQKVFAGKKKYLD